MVKKGLIGTAILVLAAAALVAIFSGGGQ